MSKSNNSNFNTIINCHFKTLLYCPIFRFFIIYTQCFSTSLKNGCDILTVPSQCKKGPGGGGQRHNQCK